APRGGALGPGETGTGTGGPGPRLRDHATRFEQAWQAGGPAELADFLPPAGDPQRLPCLHELVKVDLEMRWRRGQPVVLEYYLEKFPELRPASSLPPALVYEEYLVRHLHGDKPALSAYQGRFPGQFEEVNRMVGQQD